MKLLPVYLLAVLLSVRHDPLFYQNGYNLLIIPIIYILIFQDYKSAL